MITAIPRRNSSGDFSPYIPLVIVHNPIYVFWEFRNCLLWLHEGGERGWKEKNDPKIRPGVFDENFTEMQFAEILFSDFI